MASDEAKVAELYRRFNEPAIPMASIRRWLDQFDEVDRPTALCLLEQVEFHSYPRLVRETRLLHRQLQERLAAEGFDPGKTGNVDFSREFTCKSGDIISYIYRKSNLIPSVEFKTFDRLILDAGRDPAAQKQRALVILDDYIGTGSQFIFQFIARSAEDIRVIGNYGKVYLCAIAVHEKAIEKGLLLRSGRFDEVIRLEEDQIPDVDFKPEEENFRAALRSVAWDKIELVYLSKDVSFLSGAAGAPDRDRQAAIRRFLDKYRLEGAEGSTCFLLGRHAFFYGAPNAMPAVLLPLFKRVEDFTVYDSEHFTGITADIINYDLDSPAGGMIAAHKTT